MTLSSLKISSRSTRSTRSTRNRRTALKGDVSCDPLVEPCPCCKTAKVNSNIARSTRTTSNSVVAFPGPRTNATGPAMRTLIASSARKISAKIPSMTVQPNHNGAISALQPRTTVFRMMTTPMQESSMIWVETSERGCARSTWYALAMSRTAEYADGLVGCGDDDSSKRANAGGARTMATSIPHDFEFAKNSDGLSKLSGISDVFSNASEVSSLRMGSAAGANAAEGSRGMGDWDDSGARAACGGGTGGSRAPGVGFAEQ
mmetsp:Transcript_51128/g.155480  ORF Transcript_51128/g.155480 Transcript_51128/m.155480 type:complete len:260 (-) Transcript_51128:471-1250(-)